MNYPSRRARPGVLAASGFTLVELAVAIFIIALLLGSILVPLQTQVEQKQISDTGKTLNDIQDALLGYVIAFGNLPCPDKTSGAATGPNDTPNDGVEDFSASGKCAALYIGNTIAAGNLPWQTLGVANANADVWGNRFRYVVRAEYAQRSPLSTFSLSTTVANIKVCQVSGCGGTSTLTSSAVAGVLSYGKNGYGAINSITGATNPLPTSADEIVNTTNDRFLVSRTMSPVGSGAGEFDDIVIWLPQYLLFNRMVTAGKLP